MKNTWKTRNGSEIPISMMTDSHLLNSLRLVERWAKHQHTKILSFYLTTPGPQGDAARDCFMQECDHVFERKWTDYLPSIWKELKKEARKRGLLPRLYFNKLKQQAIKEDAAFAKELFKIIHPEYKAGQREEKDENGETIKG